MRNRRAQARVRALLFLMLAAAMVVPSPSSDALGIPRPLVRKATEVLGKVGKFLAGYTVAKGIDYVTGRLLKQEVEEQVLALIVPIRNAAGPERAALEETLAILQQQHRILIRVLQDQGADIAAIRADQERLARRLDDLSGRLGRMEQQLTELDARVRRIEEALISECIDRRYAPALGLEAFRIDESAASLLVDEKTSDALDIRVDLHLNACSAELTHRGLLIQVSLATRDLAENLTLYATFKDVSALVGGRGMAASQSLEFPLGAPRYVVDSQTLEIFLPYAEVPHLSPTDRLAIALVLTHGGNTEYVLTDKVLTCIFGQRINCRWVMR
jgi:hypothetical protein